MKISRNMSAVTTNRQLLRTESKLSISMERLSSGYKINKAGDNPAGVAISSKMRAQIDGLDQAESNSTDGESALNIADGALNEVSSMLQRIRELSVQAANGTNSYSDRESIQLEIDQLTEEIDRISADTEYNEKNLLDGSVNRRVYADGATRIDVSDEVTAQEYSLTIDSLGEEASYTLDMTNASTSGHISIKSGGVDYTAGMDMDTFYASLRDTAEKAGCTVTKVSDSVFEIKSLEKGSDEEVSMSVSQALAEEIGFSTATSANGSTAELDDESSSYEILFTGTDATATLGDNFDATATVSADGNRIKVTAHGGFSMDFLLEDSVAAGDTLTFDVTDVGSMCIQIGANQYQDMEVNIPEISSESLYLDTVNVAVTGGAEKAMLTLDDAIAKLSSVRSAIGAYTNRLDYASSSLAETEEDMTSAYSNIMDTDMAEEMTEYTQQNVLEQAAISVLSQANELPQQVLSLLQ